MLPIFGYAALNEIGEKAIVAANPAGNSAGPMLAQEVGGDLLYALVAGVTIATILAVLAGMAIAVSGAVAHDLYTSVFKRGDVDERGQLHQSAARPARAARCIAILLAFGAKNLNIANVANIAFAIAASTTMPTLLLTIYWRGFNQVGAVSAMVGGLTCRSCSCSSAPTCSARTTRSGRWRSRRSSRCPPASCSPTSARCSGRGRVGSTGMPYDEFEQRAFPPADGRSRQRRAGAGRRGMTAVEPALAGELDRDGAALSAYLEGGGEDPDGARERFLRVHADALHLELCDGRSRPLRLEALLARAAERVPGLVPAGEALEAEHARALADKQGLELAQGLLLSHVLAAPAAGAHLVWSMLRPTAEALERLDDFRATGVADLGPAHLRREGRAGVLELRNPRHLNAEDDIDAAPRPRSRSTSRCSTRRSRSASSAAASSSTRATRGGGSSAPAST